MTRSADEVPAWAAEFNFVVRNSGNHRGVLWGRLPRTAGLIIGVGLLAGTLVLRATGRGWAYSAGLAGCVAIGLFVGVMLLLLVCPVKRLPTIEEARVKT